jgi:hypothetical protein
MEDRIVSVDSVVSAITSGHLQGSSVPSLQTQSYLQLKIRSVESFDEMNRVEQSTPATSPVTAVKEESVKKSRIYTIDEILGRSSSNQTGKFH